MNPLTKAVLDAGLVPGNVHREQSRWNPELPVGSADPVPLDKAVEKIQAAVAPESDALRETERELSTLFADPMKVRHGQLVLCAPGTDLRPVTLPVEYVPRKRQVVFRHNPKVNLAEILTFTEKSHLITEEGTQVFFSAAEDRYVGDVPAFVVART